MKVAHLLLAIAFAPLLCSQTVKRPPYDQVTSRAFLRQLEQDGIYNFISKEVADSLLEHRVELTWPHQEMEARIEATVIVAFEITKQGRVMHPMAVSGPPLLRPAVVKAISQWRFRPYLLNGEAVAVATSYPMHVSNF